MQRLDPLDPVFLFDRPPRSRSYLMVLNAFLRLLPMLDKAETRSVGAAIGPSCPDLAYEVLQQIRGLTPPCS